MIDWIVAIGVGLLVLLIAAGSSKILGRRKPSGEAVPTDRWRVVLDVEIPLALHLGQLTGYLAIEALKHGAVIRMATGEVQSTTPPASPPS